MSTTGDDEAKMQMQRLDKALNLFRDISPTMPLGQVRAFLIVGMNEGISGVDAAKKAGMPANTMGRYLMDFSVKTRDGGPGYGLIERGNAPDSLKLNSYTLSPKGKRLLGEVVRALSS